MQRSRGDRLFDAGVITTLAALVLFFALLVAAAACHVRWGGAPAVLLSREVLAALRLSLLTATAASLLAMCVALPAAYALSRLRFPGKDLLDTLLDLPVMISPVAMGALLLIFFNDTAAGRLVERGLVRFTFEVPGIVLAQFVVVALALRLLKSSFDEIDPRYENVVRTLGATRAGAFFHVALPMARPGIVAAAVLSWARAFGEFGATVTLAGAAAMKTETLPAAIYLGFARADVQGALVVALLLVAIALVVLFGLRKLGGRVLGR